MVARHHFTAVKVAGDSPTFSWLEIDEKIELSFKPGAEYGDDCNQNTGSDEFVFDRGRFVLEKAHTQFSYSKLPSFRLAAEATSCQREPSNCRLLFKIGHFADFAELWCADSERKSLRLRRSRLDNSAHLRIKVARTEGNAGAEDS